MTRLIGFLALSLMMAGGALAEPARQAGPIFRDCADCPEMVVVPAGQFLMGAVDDDGIPESWEQPVHRVNIARPIAVGRFEITFEEWDRCYDAGACAYLPDDGPWGRGRQPVFRVAHEDIGPYLDWLSQVSGHRYRLLSEAEWEYAARGGTTTAFHTGANIGVEQANFSDGQPRPVGSYPPNPFGLYDMAGNVWEQTEDCFNDSYVGAPTDGRPRLSGDCESRVQRGGSFNVNADPHYVRSAHRSYQARSRTSMGEDEIEMHSTGFRVARDL